MYLGASSVNSNRLLSWHTRSHPLSSPNHKVTVLSPPSRTRIARINCPHTDSPRNPPKLLKSENEEVSRGCTASDGHPMNLNRKLSNCQQQQPGGGLMMRVSDKCESDQTS
ncbi:hypothetical protein TSMEX_006206 [Taenia solium]|eukprot:TsM_001135100 transcript=TsM_001135100 gene=TsM_001135100